MRTFAATATCAVLALGFLGVARAGDDSTASRIGVVVTGHVDATADIVELEFTVSCAADESVDAERRYRDKLARVVAALSGTDKTKKKEKKEKKEDDDEAPPKKKPPVAQPMPAPAPAPGNVPGVAPSPAPRKAKPKKEEDDDEDEAPKKKVEKDDPSKDKEALAIPVEVTERKLSCGVKSAKSDDGNPMAKLMRAQMGGGADKSEPPIHFASKVVATIKGAAKLEKSALTRRIALLLDTGTDAGADGPDGSAPVVRFLVEDPESWRKAAYKDAMRRAKDRAQELASLSGKKLGAVFAVHELSAAHVIQPKDAGGKDQGSANIFAQIYGIKSDAPSPEGTMELSADVELRVEFTLE